MDRRKDDMRSQDCTLHYSASSGKNADFIHATCTVTFADGGLPRISHSTYLKLCQRNETGLDASWPIISAQRYDIASAIQSLFKVMAGQLICIHCQ